VLVVNYDNNNTTTIDCIEECRLDLDTLLECSWHFLHSNLSLNLSLSLSLSLSRCLCTDLVCWLVGWLVGWLVVGYMAAGYGVAWCIWGVACLICVLPQQPFV
jgi:hypothetical protein